MEYLENAFKFWGKFKWLIVPLFILCCVAVFLGNPTLKEITGTLNEVTDLGLVTGEAENIDLYDGLYKIAQNIGILLQVVLLVLFLSIFIFPATYGMIIRGYETGATGLGSFFTSLKKYFIKFILYFLSVLIIMAAVAIIYLLFFFIFPFIFIISWQLATIVFIGVIIASVIFLCFLFNVLNIWFVALAWDDMKVLEGFFKAFELVKGCFWSCVGIAFSMAFIYITVNALIGGVLENIIIVSYFIKSFLLSMCIYVLMVYGFELYRDKTEKNSVLGDYL